MTWEESWHLESPLRSKPHGGFGGGRRETDLSRHRARRLSYYVYYPRPISVCTDKPVRLAISFLATPFLHHPHQVGAVSLELAGLSELHALGFGLRILDRL